MKRIAVRAPRGVVAVLRRARTEVIEHTGDIALRAVVTEAAEKPQLVLNNRSTDGRIEVPQRLHAVDGFQTAIEEVLVEIIGLKVGVREVAKEPAAVGVAAFLRNDVRQHAARPGLRGQPARRHGHFLHGPGVHDQRGVVTTAGVVHVIERHPVHDQRHLVRAAAVYRQCLESISAGPAYILGGQRGLHARHKHAEILETAARRQPVNGLLGHRFSLRHALRVDERTLAGHRHGFSDGAHAEVGIHSRRKVRRQHDALAQQRVETWERERHGIRARAQVDNLEHALAVGNNRSDLLDKGGAGGFHGHAG